MERVMSVEDRIRKAEEIYYRKREQENPVTEYELRRNTAKREKKKDIKLLKKMITQILICLIIYSIFHTIINNNYIFTEDFTNKIKEILAQDIDISKIYSIILTKSNEIIKKISPIQEENTEPSNNTEQNLENNEENIGGADENITDGEINVTTEQNQATVELTQMEKDVLYIKNTVNFIKPVEGTISSAYGERNPTTSTVPKNHTGTDIAAAKGSKIISATDGTVILVSSEGDYGNHLKIQINDVIIIYAHCQNLYVKQGDIIKQGQEIATVGSTGNSTGPHLHFEIRYQNRYVDPQLILEI